MEDQDIERKLSGRTLQVYIYLQRKREPSGVREVQRDLCLSSPSVADYQIEKLAGMGLVAKDNHGRVFVTRKVKVKALESYIDFGRFSVPRLAFYASVFSAIAVLYVAFSISDLSIYGIAVPAAAAAVLWAEAWKVGKSSFSEKARNSKTSESQALLRMLMPGIAAAIVLTAAGIFLFQYSFHQGSVVAIPMNPPYEPSENRLTTEESAELSRQKVVAAGGADSISESVLTGMIFACAVAAGFFVYIITKYRRVLEPEHLSNIRVRNAGLYSAPLMIHAWTEKENR